MGFINGFQRNHEKFNRSEREDETEKEREREKEKKKDIKEATLGPVWYTCLKTENCYLKSFIKIRVGKKSGWKYVKCYLKTKNYYLETFTKHPFNTCLADLFN